MYNNFNNNEEPQETVRQTLERVMREKGYKVDENNYFQQSTNNMQQNNSGFSPTTSIVSEAENNYRHAQEKTHQQCIQPSAFDNGDYRGRIEALKRVESRSNMTPLHPDYTQPATLYFDGKNIAWLENGEPVKYYSGMSGKPNKQSAQYTNEINEGPIPEGNYVLKQGSGEYHKPGEWRTFDEFISGTGIWKRNPIAWGNSRIPIQPLSNTNTLGRHSMYIHGGDILGSAGCIDLTGRNDDFYDDYKRYDGDLYLEVKYPKNW
jgi:hypothetical protein